MGILRQMRDGLRLAPFVPPGKLLKNRRKLRRIKNLVREYCLFLCLDALEEWGLAGALASGPVDPGNDSNFQGLDMDTVRAVTEYLEALGLLAVDGAEMRLTRRGRKHIEGWNGFPELFSGYRPVLERLSRLGRGETGEALRRDEKKIRAASTALGFDFAYPLISGLLAARGVLRVLELGSSRLALLKYLCDRNGVTGWGLDIDPQAVADSRASLRGTAYEGRIKVFEGDALSPSSLDIPAGDVEAILAVDLLHYYLKDRARVTAALAGWRERLPSSLFIVVEICRRPAREAARSSLPKLEYDLCHRLTGQALPSEQDWVEIFTAAGYRLADKRVFPSLEHGAFVFRSADRKA